MVITPIVASTIRRLPTVNIGYLRARLGKLSTPEQLSSTIAALHQGRSTVYHAGAGMLTVTAEPPDLHIANLTSPALLTDINQRILLAHAQAVGARNLTAHVVNPTVARIMREKLGWSMDSPTPTGWWMSLPVGGP